MTPNEMLAEIRRLEEHRNRLADRVTALDGVLKDVISNIDVSTINNSKRSTDRWVELKRRAQRVLGGGL